MSGVNRRVVRSSRGVLARHARSFRWASLFLGRRRRDDAALAYAFCRLVDDAVDEQSDPTQARQALGQIEGDLAAAKPASELVAAYRELAARRGFGLTPAGELLDGARSDLGPVRIANDAELLQYCYRVAGTVGLMMSRIVGVKQAAALPHAIDLGIAMQLTNICRDVLEDAGRNRAYLPAERLRAAGSSQDRLVAGSADPRAVAAVVCDLLELAERCYRSGDHGMRYIPRAPRLAILVASRIYRAIGRRLRRRYGGDALRGRVVVPAASKVLWLLAAMAAWVGTLGSWRRESRFPHRPVPIYVSAVQQAEGTPQRPMAASTAP